MNSFFKGTLLLIVAAFFSECIEFFVNMILARELGEEGMGRYMSILPVIFLVAVLASFELPISISKYIAENKRVLHYSMLRHALQMTMIVTLAVLMASIILFSATSLLDGFHPIVKWLIIGLIPIASFSSIARGYFMGVQQMGKIAFSNFLRKAVQFSVLLLIFTIFRFDQNALLIALCAFIGSELIVFVYLISMFMIHMHALKYENNTFTTGKHARQKLLSVSLPTTGLRIFHAITNAVQPFLIQTALITAGFSTVAATEHFGMLTGVAMTIGFFPAFIAHSLMIMLIPNVSDSYAKQDTKTLRVLLQQSMSFTMLYGIPAVFIIYLFAEPLTSLFFSSDQAAFYLKLLWPYFLFHFFVIPMQAYLIGLGLVKDAFYHTVWSHIVSFGMMFLLGSQPSLQMAGIILGMNTGIVLLTLMHYVTICQKIGITLWLTERRDSVYR
ncbi:polysaccharide biosynthesis protein [Metabacillus idriensis]|uniref:polysaccharide biosynthesis protein n=1 Tax=Metabacillus idriensis TaxID=324768 RepID=UPI00203ECBBD|nr:polysaccharide biosynthesis protein [Metabacillus idriensis]MCM3594668.1 polysaccharide biosynthesis protein [Metabacillus idriensis]